MIVTDGILNEELENMKAKLAELGLLSDYFFFQLLFETGVRVNEARELERWAKIDNNTYRLLPQKENTFRYFTADQIPKSLQSSIEDQVNYFAKMSIDHYRYVVNIYLKGWNWRIGKKGVSTHLFRHNYVKQNIESGVSVIDLQTEMGLLSSSTVSMYLNSIIEADFE